MKHNPDQSWLSGKYIIDNQNVEINTLMSFISIDGYRNDFFAQGEDAETFISEIHNIWIKTGCTTEEAVQKWINIYL